MKSKRSSLTQRCKVNAQKHAPHIALMFTAIRYRKLATSHANLRVIWLALSYQNHYCGNKHRFVFWTTEKLLDEAQQHFRACGHLCGNTQLWPQILGGQGSCWQHKGSSPKPFKSHNPFIPKGNADYRAWQYQDLGRCKYSMNSARLFMNLISEILSWSLIPLQDAEEIKAEFLLEIALQSLAGRNFNAAFMRLQLCKDQLLKISQRGQPKAETAVQLGAVCGSQVRDSAQWYKFIVSCGEVQSL